MISLGGSVLVISPHIDDAGLSCFSYLNNTHSFEILNVFSMSLYTRFGYGDQRKITELRVDEDQCAWVNQLDKGVNIYYLGLEDSSVRKDDTFCNPSMYGALVDLVVEEMEFFFSRANSVLLPAACGNHIDHVVCRLASEVLLEKYLLPHCYYADQFYYSYPFLFSREFMSTIKCNKRICLDVKRKEKENFLLKYNSQLDGRIITDVLHAGEIYYEL